MELLILFLLKLGDGILSTAKQISMVKGRYFSAAVTASLSTVFYLVIVVMVAKSNTPLTIGIVALAVFLGTYIPCLISKKMEKDVIYCFNVTVYNKEDIDLVLGRLDDAKIPYLDFHKDAFTYVKVFAQNKEESKIVGEMIPKTCKYHVVPTKTVIFEE